MPNVPYSNFFLSNEVEDQYNSLLDLQRFVKVDNGLVGTPGMVRKINVYSATDSVQKVVKGAGNTLTTEAGYVQKEYEIQTAQGRFAYFDEEAMADPEIVVVGTRHLGVDMFNTVNADVYGEWKKAPQVVVASGFDFDAFADAQSMLNVENLEGITVNAFVCAADVAALRKALKTSLQYVEAFARQGYVGTVAGVNVYTKKDATPGTIVLATNDAATIFNKKGTEVEIPARSTEESNIRQNWVYARKFYVVALTNEAHAVLIETGVTATLSSDTTVSSSKTYYKASGLGYVKVTPAGTENPTTEGWYEIA